MTPVGSVLKEEIARFGPVSFHRFMEVALCHAEHGYYCCGQDHFGKEGDWYTAEQLQPVLGILIAACIRALFHQMGSRRDLTAVELGAGRGEMAEFLSEFNYHPVEVGDDMPDRFRGVVFANEFFDTLPAELVVKRSEGFREMLVDFNGNGSCWIDGGGANEKIAGCLDRHASPAREGALLEVSQDGLAWIETISRRLARGCPLVIDYGYTAAEVVRFPAGTLMSYRLARCFRERACRSRRTGPQCPRVLHGPPAARFAARP